MNLDRNTYEAWLLDRIEGRLTPAQEQALDAFLAANPDLPAFGAGEALDLGGDAIRFAGKEALHRELPPRGLPEADRLNDFLVALGEGDLSAKQVRELQRYLYEHPEAKRDARLMELARAVTGPGFSMERDALLRTFPPSGVPDRHRLNDFLIAELEGDLSPVQQAMLGAFMKAHPELGRERSLVAATKVAAGVEVYAHKAELRKREGKVIGMWSRPMVVRLAAAASIALLLGLGIWSLMRAPRQEPQVAEVKETTPGQKAPEGVVQERVQEKEPVLSQPETHSPAVEPQRSNQESVPEQQENPSAPEQPRNLREAAPSLAHLEPVQGAQDPANANPVQVEEQAPAASIPAPDEFLAAASAKEVPTLGGLVAQRMRGAVLDQRAPEAHGFQEADAVAAVDKGLKRLGGDDAGLAVQRDGRRLKRFDLRLGNGMGITASR
ncbi:MAG: hypothetical protein IPG10_05055 [Flavobacteriales bacterium]|nr:hypothetical protein [Flavobacteriales bacterium]MBK6753048.1 hypothetical protein [Flavobacteriales bacterium]MBK7268422.1 hypothetical protein [Flavobacteriales bacterium]MBK7752747.1 hypothetical protein [Flavobacteriales bacterium]MBK9538962.1 hypothetical protein [Flavobacteriales bacterium]